MGINNYRPEELTNQRKKISDAKNDTEDLTFKSDGSNGSRAKAYKGVRDIKDDRLINSLLDHDDSAYFEEVFNSL